MKYLLMILLSTYIFAGDTITCERMNVENNSNGVFTNMDTHVENFEFYVEDSTSIVTNKNTSYKLTFKEWGATEKSGHKYKMYEQKNYNLLYVFDDISHGLIYVGYEYTIYYDKCSKE